jgi:hypothetical protein
MTAVDDALFQRRLDREPHAAVEHCGRETAMHRAGGIEVDVPGFRSNDDTPVSASVTSYPNVWAIVLRGSVPSARPCTNSRPLISFCLPALTVPYVFLTLWLGIASSPTG